MDQISRQQFSQSDASIQVTWSLLTNQRPVSALCRTKNRLTCQYWGVWVANNTTTAFWTHSTSLFCQKYLLIVCVRGAFLSHKSRGGWNKKLISWLWRLQFLCWLLLTRAEHEAMNDRWPTCSSSKPRSKIHRIYTRVFSGWWMMIMLMMTMMNGV